MIIAEWDAPEVMPVFEVSYEVATTNHRVRLDGRKAVPPPANLDHYLRPTKLIPTDGIVKDTALAITSKHATPLARARAIYDWIVEHTVRDPEVKGCGLGDIRWMLETEEPERQVRGPECAVRRPRARGGLAGPRSLRIARRAVAAVSQPRPHGSRRHHRAALPRRGVGRRPPAGFRWIPPTCAS